MSEYKFGIGEHPTRGGETAVIYAEHDGMLFGRLGYTPLKWLANGRYFISPTATSDNDLMPPAPAKPEPVVRWVNLYQRKDGSLAFGGGAHATLSDAQDASRLGLGAFLRTIRISSDNEDRYAAGWDAALDAVAVKLSEIGTLSGVNTAFSLKGKANA